MNRDQQPAPPGPATEDPVLRILETPLLGRLPLGTVTALVRRIRFVRAGAGGSG